MAKKLPLKWFPGYTADIRLRKVDKWAEYNAKHGSPYFDTWEEAHQFMVERSMNKLQRCEKEMASELRHFTKVMVMKKPEGKES